MKKYHAFLLRIWQTGQAEPGAWRASLEDPHTRQVRMFASLEKLCAYLVALQQDPSANRYREDHDQ